MPSLESAIQINIRDATFALPSETYGELIVVGEDANKPELFNQVKTYYSQAEVEADYGADSPIAKATAKIFMQGVSHVKAVNVIKDETGTKDYDTVLNDLIKNQVDFDIVVPTINASDANAQKLVDFAGANKKLLVLPAIGGKDDVIAQFNALTENEFVFAIAHSNANEAELAGAVAGVIGLTLPWIPCEWMQVQGIEQSDYKPSEVDELEQNNINTIINIVRNVISGAKVLTGSFVDIPRTKIYLATEIKNALVNLKLRLANMGRKIPYTPQGLEMIKSVIESVLRRSQSLGALRPDYTDAEGNLVRGYEVQMPAWESISDSDKASRVLRNVTIIAYLSGAVSKIQLDLVITL